MDVGSPLSGLGLMAPSTRRVHKRPYVGVSQGTVLGFGDGFGAILWEIVTKS